MTYAELETACIALCNDVQKQTLRIIGLAGAGRAEDAGRAAATLAEYVGTAKQQHKMQQERAGGNYDLAALSVNTEVPSNSENGWEKKTEVNV